MKITDCYGHVGTGWHALLTAAHAEIQKVDPDYSVAQVKEKFGGLRLYLDGKQEIHAIALKWDSLSYHVCEACGKAGKMDSAHGWYKTLCPEHTRSPDTKAAWQVVSSDKTPDIGE